MYQVTKYIDNMFSHKFVVCSFYTEGYYEEVMQKNLLPSLRKFGLPFYIEGIKGYSDWKKNTNLKSLFLQKLVSNFNLPVVWLDADSEVVKYPDLFEKFSDTVVDFGLFKLDWETWYKNGAIREEFLSGIIYIKPGEETKAIVNDWVARVKAAPDVIEQKHLELAVYDSEQFPYLKTQYFPLEYCYISSMPDGSEPKVKLKDPVILQHQASRVYKKFRGSKE